MSTRDSQIPEAKELVPPPAPVVEVAAGAMGVLGGAATGAVMAGPLGAIAGAVVGGALGAVSGWAADMAGEDTAAAEAALDEEIGVTAGTIGEPSLRHPPSKIGAPSAAAVGLGAASEEPEEAAGPLQAPPT